MYQNMRWPCLYDNPPSQSPVFGTVTVQNVFNFVHGYKETVRFSGAELEKEKFSCYIPVNVHHF